MLVKFEVCVIRTVQNALLTLRKINCFVLNNNLAFVFYKKIQTKIPHIKKNNIYLLKL